MSCPPYPSSAGSVIVTTSAARPVGADLYPGRYIYETDTLRTQLYDGTGWIVMDEPVISDTSARFTNFTTGTPTYSTLYHRSGGYVDVVSTLTFGSTPGSMASLSWTPPINGAAIPVNNFRVAFYDASAGSWYDGQSNEGTAAILLFASAVSGTVISISNVTLTVPFTWAVSDRAIVSGRYRMTTRYS